jgi:DNA repair protein RadC
VHVPETRRGPSAVSHGHAIRELPVAERPRERLAQRGPAGLTAAELIALLWGSGTRGRSAIDVATDALAAHDGLEGIARASELELGALPGIGPAKAAQLIAAFEIGRTPSADDLHLTAEAMAAGRLLDIGLLDHLVIGHDAYVSLRDRGVVFDRTAGPGPAT